jgi:hypothetical protein
VDGTSAERTFTLVIGTIPSVERTFTLVIGTVPPAERTFTCVYISRNLRCLVPAEETSCYSISRSLQVPARRLEAPAGGISGPWFLRRETSNIVKVRSVSKMHIPKLLVNSV